MSPGSIFFISLFNNSLHNNWSVTLVVCTKSPNWIVKRRNEEEGFDGRTEFVIKVLERESGSEELTGF